MAERRDAEFHGMPEDGGTLELQREVATDTKREPQPGEPGGGAVTEAWLESRQKELGEKLEKTVAKEDGLRHDLSMVGRMLEWVRRKRSEESAGKPPDA